MPSQPSPPYRPSGGTTARVPVGPREQSSPTTEPTLRRTSKTKGAKVDKTEKPKIMPVRPDDAIVPERGLQKVLYWLNCNVRKRPDLVPSLGKSEQRDYDLKIAEQIQQRAEQVAIDELRKLTDEKPSGIVAFFGIKGAAATTATVVYSASVIAQQTNAMLFVLDANPASGDSAARLGKDHGETASIQDLAELLSGGSEIIYKNFIAGIRPSKYGVRAITAASIIGGDNRVSAESMERIVDVCDEYSEYLFVDTANDVTESVTRVIATMAHQYVFTANVRVHSSLTKLGTTMETLRQQGFADKVANSAVLISNLPDGANLDDCRKYLNIVNLEDKVVLERTFDGPFLAVHHDPEIARDGIVNLSALQRETVQEYRRLGNAIFTQLPYPGDTRHQAVTTEGDLSC